MSEVLSLNAEETVKVYEIQLKRFNEVNTIRSTYKKDPETKKTELKKVYNRLFGKLKNALDKIAKLGKKMFEGLFRFIGMELDSKTKITYPSDINGFVFGMAD